MIRKTVSLAIVALVAAPLFAADWPQFRGGPALGLVADAALPLAWDKSPGSKGKIVWRSAIPGAGWSQPVSVDGRIYLTTAVIPGGRKPKGMTGGVMDLSTMGWGKPPKDPAAARPTAMPRCRDAAVRRTESSCPRIRRSGPDTSPPRGG